jgi:hypothetical protein
MSCQKILTSRSVAALKRDSVPNIQTADQGSESREAQIFMNTREQRRKPPKITVKSLPGRPLNIDMQDIDAVRLSSAFGTVDPGFTNLMLSGIINTACDRRPGGSPEAGEINDALAAVTGIGARDEIEGMLATQMVATHVAAVRVLRHLKGSEKITQQDSNGNLAVKLLRTFTMQLEALQRYRGKGQQKVTVEHVHVNAGGQAIVGTVHPLAAKKSEEPV